MRTKGGWKAVLPLLFAAVYGASPVDLIPDVLLLIGWVDDATVALLMGCISIWMFVRSRRASVPSPDTLLTRPFTK